MPPGTAESAINDLENLHTLCGQDSRLAAFVAAELQALKELVRNVSSAKDRQEYLTAERSKATAEYRGQLGKARDLGSAIRSGVVAFYGPRSEKLAAFKIKQWKPNRKSA